MVCLRRSNEKGRMTTTAPKTIKVHDLSKKDDEIPLAKRPRTHDDEEEIKTKIDRLVWDDADDANEKKTAADFFRDYVATRKPCIIETTTKSEATISTLKAWPSTLELKNLLGDCPVQVEERLDEKRTFGQNRSVPGSMKTMSFGDFVSQDPDKRSRFYLSTQQPIKKTKNNGKSGSDDDDDDDDDDGTNNDSDDDLYPKYSCLTERLVQHKYIAQSMALAGHLALDSCHLWMGATQGSCSGLHHDFHDNFYALQRGRKVFYLYPPTTPIPTYGTIEQIHPNGLISYVSKPTRADGVPLNLIAAVAKSSTKHQHNDEDEDEDDQEEDEIDDDDEEEVVIGKGFDYQSDNDEEEQDEMDSTRDDFDDLDEDVKATNDAVDGSTKAEVEPRPDHFSPVDLTLSTIHTDFPVMRQYKPLIVQVRAGETLYLPASWFHCVWSHADQDDFHIAINYWYHPPDQLDRFSNPYKSDFWSKQRPEMEL